MFKKISSYLLIVLFCFCLIACQNKDKDKDPTPEPDDPIVPPIVYNDESSLVEKITGRILYASPDGLQSNDGSESSPLNIGTAFLRLTAGDTLILKDGVYTIGSKILIEERQSGNFASYITVKAENANKAILDFSMMKFDGSNRGIQVNGNYWYFYGIDVKGAGDNGMYIGGDYNIVEMCQFYENRDTGLQLGRADGSYTNIKDWPNNNLIKNCTSFNNYDDETYGENADGFAAKLTVGEGNIFDGCIAFRNADDGWDTYAKSDTGNVGLTIIRNCISFENGWTLTKHPSDFRDPSSSMVYTTRDGDGIGFKLGGSKMEGSVYVENCLAFNNHLGGFSDNSNPGVISIRNCTSYNNSVSINIDGTPGPSDGVSRNIDIARKNMSGTNSDSYNNYYGILSYCTNETDPNIVYNQGDTFKGSCGYSIFSKYSARDKKANYFTFTEYQDANSYESDKAGTALTKTLTDAIFASVELAYTDNQYSSFHTTFRNADGSVNFGDTLKIVDTDLLTYCAGKPIGANLSLSSWEDYNHTEFVTPEVGKTTVNMARVIGAYDALDIMCNPDAVFQNVKLLTICNECTITWKSSDDSIVKVQTEEIESLSKLAYVDGVIYRDINKDVSVKLTATIVYDGAMLEKEFTLNIMQDEPKIGTLLGCEDKYILDQYSSWTLPEVQVTNLSSNAGLLLTEGEDYTLLVSYKYAEDKNSTYYDVSDVYTSVPGVYEVTYTAKSLIDANDQVNYQFYVYVSSDTAPIELSENGSGINFHVSSTGVDISAELSSTSGYMYVYTTDAAFALPQTVISSGQKFVVSDEKISISLENANNEGYYIYVLFTNKAGTYTSSISNARIEIKTISTCQEFYDFVTSGTSSTTIYSLQNDLDFKDYEWKEKIITSTFGGFLNGNNHTISNLTIEGTSPKNVNIFYKVSGGTIMNLHFTNISLTGSGDSTTKVGIIGQLCDGTIENVKMNNISAYGYQGVSALVGQVVGGINNIHQVSLVNDDTCTIFATGKYCGGIIGNLQKDSSELQCELYVDNCYVDACIGGTTDTGGYTGGIVGRYKNDFDICVLSIDHCVVYGKIMTGKNYAGGITGGCDYGLGSTKITHCLADVEIYYVGTWIDGVKAVSVKNGSPIMGRQTLGLGIFTYYNNYGSFDDYNDGVSDAEGYDMKIYREYFWQTSMDLNADYWEIDLDEGDAKLK